MDRKVETKTKISFKIHLVDKNAFVQGIGEVIRIEVLGSLHRKEMYGVALKFEDIPSNDYQVLCEYLHERRK